ncbi:MAG: hypothetical protein S4CHLAM102_04100 [Chlamydiia bacterium]|nr:hypothetical protein [Chlamydiia bacterium]
MKKSFFLLASLFTCLFATCQASETPAQPYTVIVLLEASAGQEEALKQALTYIAEESRKESSCIEYHVHQDATSPAKFALYEKWESQALHQEQFKKSYILEFVTKAETLLAGPYQGLFGEEIALVQ